MPSSRTPLIAASVVAIGLGALIAYSLSSENKPAVAPVEADAGAFDQTQRLQDLGTRLRTAEPIPEDVRGGERYLENRWGHLGDTGLSILMTDIEGQKYFVEPAVFPAWTPKGRNYAVAVAKPMVMDDSQRLRGRATANAQAYMTIENFQPSGVMERALRTLKPIRDPSDLPDDAPDEVRSVFK